MNHRQGRRPLSATTITTYVSCKRRPWLTLRRGEPQADAALQARRAAGDSLHQQIHVLATAQHNVTRRAPCYIATRVFGDHAPETNRLRRFRDEVLLPTPVGRVMVRGYYAIGPYFARTIGRSTTLTRTVQRLLRRFIGLLERVP